MNRRYLNAVFIIIFSVTVIHIWQHIIGILFAIAIPEHYVQNPDGTFHGKMYVIVIWDLLVIHIPSLLMPCAILAVPFRIWVVKRSKMIISMFAAVFFIYYASMLISSFPVVLPDGILASIYAILPTPYPILGVAFGVWLGSKLDPLQRGHSA